MPLESRAQERAMGAAAGGHSTLGIPKSVGREFLAAGPASNHLPERKGGHRGKRGSGKGHKAGDPADHLQRLHDAHGKGDHLNARKHAFAFVRALDAKHGVPAKKAEASVAKLPPMENAPQKTAAGDASRVAPKSNPSRLLAALKASKMSRSA